MNLKKHLGAKIAALLASLAAVGGIWGLVHQNPPQPSAAAAAAAASSTPASGPAQAAPKVTRKVAQPAPARRHTRTHVS
jgi:hypothetical protein